MVASKIYSDFFSGLLAVPPTRPSGHPSLCVMNFYCDGAFGFTSWLPAPHFPHFPLTSYADFPLLPSQGGCALSWLLHIHDLYLGHKESMGRNEVSLLLMLLLLRLLFILMALPRAQINITHFWPTSTPPAPVVPKFMYDPVRVYSIFAIHMSPISECRGFICRRFL